MREGLGDARRATRGSVGRVATGARTQMPPGLQGHRLQYDGPKNRKCMNCTILITAYCMCDSKCARTLLGIIRKIIC
jgi:hypothetical protein